MESVHNRVFHHASVHAGRIVVWGGILAEHLLGGLSFPEGEIVVYDPSSLAWTKHKTRGFPTPCNSICKVTAVTVGDDMYVVDSLEGRCRVRALDLPSLTWREIETTGEVPGFVYLKNPWLLGNGGDIVVRSVYDCGSLAVFDTKGRSWRWPRCSGVPPRHTDASFSVGNMAYVLDSDGTLYRLDMVAWTWDRMVPDLPLSDTIERDYFGSGYSLTLLPQSRKGQQVSRALLYGRNCWMLHLSGGLSYHWTSCQHLDKGPRMHHQAVVESATGQVWLLGGYKRGSPVRNMIKLTVTRPLSLVVSSFKAMVGEREGRLKDGIKELPKTLRSSFNAFVKTEVDTE